MKILAINWTELEEGFDNSSYEFDYYLDTETGQVLMVTEEARMQLETVYQQYGNVDEGEVFDLAAVLSQTDLQEWQQQDVIDADKIEADLGSRYLAVPRRGSREAYQIMRDFIVTVEDDPLKERLWQAISGRGAFRYFKDVLYQHPDEQKRWFAYQDARLKKEMREWLEMEGIEPTNEPRATEKPKEELHPIRQQMLQEVLWFTQAASQIHGVSRIALIGSLATGKTDPRDIDMLVTITQEIDLPRLATLGRKLQGHMQNIAHGGDVFLADPQNRYLGRTCPWKQCGPRIRLSCDALHCGRRLYLHDDLKNIRLAAEIIAAPPVELWPQVITRVALPDDVAMMLQKIEAL